MARKKHKIIVIEGTDCSGKETQSNLLIEKLTGIGIPVYKTQCPFYGTATGDIVAGPYLGKENYSDTYFKEGAANVNPFVSALYFAADRKYNIPAVMEGLSKHNVLLDRYVDSNMAHQGGKILDKKERFKTYKFFEKLEYGLLKLPRPNVKILLYMPYEYAQKLKKSRKEKPDGLEASESHLRNAEKAYLEIAKRNHYKIINCVKDNEIRSKEDIHNEIFNYMLTKLK